MYAENFSKQCEKKERSSGRAEEGDKKKKANKKRKENFVFMGRDAGALPPKPLSNVTTRKRQGV
jgi:hypothetical protein